MNKFKVGDEVRILDGSKIKGYIGGWASAMQLNVSKTAKISSIETQEEKYCYRLEDFKFEFERYTESCFYDERGLELVNTSTKTLIITTSDSTTTLTDGTHTTTINRYYTDKHNERNAVSIVIDKYYDELNEIDRVSKLPKVGDKVKVIDHGKTYPNYDTWLIENNIAIQYAIKWMSGKYPSDEYTYKIVAIYKHLESKEILALIEDKYGCYIINIKGLEVIK